MKDNEIGIFKAFWDGLHPHHLPLMNLRNDQSNKDWNIDISLKRLEKIFKENDRITIIADMQNLIAQRNWRPQLIFCISIIKLKDKEQILITKLWDKISEYNSWIIPQLISTAYIVDERFEEKAKAILQTINGSVEYSRMNKDELFVELGKGNIKDQNKSQIALNWRNKMMDLIDQGKIKIEYNKP